VRSSVSGTCRIVRSGVSDVSGVSGTCPVGRCLLSGFSWSGGRRAVVARQEERGRLRRHDLIDLEAAREASRARKLWQQAMDRSDQVFCYLVSSRDTQHA
jgi:hypothetical protein